MLVTDIIGVFIEPLLGLSDLGLLVQPFTMPAFCLLALLSWFRGFRIYDRSGPWLLWSVVTLPLWFVLTAIVTFLNFPLGRINPNF